MEIKSNKKSVIQYLVYTFSALLQLHPHHQNLEVRSCRTRKAVSTRNNDKKKIIHISCISDVSYFSMSCIQPAALPGVLGSQSS